MVGNGEGRIFERDERAGDDSPSAEGGGGSGFEETGRALRVGYSF